MDGTLHQQRIETAPMMGIWRSLAPVVAQIIRCQPSLASRLSLAPSRTIHAMAAFLHHRLKQPLDSDALAQELATRDARDLLAEAIPRPHHRLYGLLGRLGSGAKSLAFYEELNHELGQPGAEILLEAPSIRLHTIRIARQVRADPVLLAARKAIGEDELHLRQLASALGLLRSLNLANHIERLPVNSGIQAIFRRVKMDLRSGRPPPVAFAVPVGWAQVQDVGQLVRIGELLQNCLAVYAGC